MGEYAILFAIVLGAAIAMQQFVKARLQGAIKRGADDYMNTVGSNVAAYEPDRKTDSQSTSNLTMQSAKTGKVKMDSQSDTTVTK